MQFPADILGMAIYRPLQTEVASLGAGYLAGLAVGLFKIGDLNQPVEVERVFRPRMSVNERQERYTRWLEAVERSKGWAG